MSSFPVLERRKPAVAGQAIVRRPMGPNPIDTYAYDVPYGAGDSVAAAASVASQLTAFIESGLDAPLNPSTIKAMSRSIDAKFKESEQFARSALEMHRRQLIASYAYAISTGKNTDYILAKLKTVLDVLRTMGESKSLEQVAAVAGGDSNATVAKMDEMAKQHAKEMQELTSKLNIAKTNASEAEARAKKIVDDHSKEQDKQIADLKKINDKLTVQLRAMNQKVAENIEQRLQLKKLEQEANDHKASAQQAKAESNISKKREKEMEKRLEQIMQEAGESDD